MESTAHQCRPFTLQIGTSTVNNFNSLPIANSTQGDSSTGDPASGTDHNDLESVSDCESSVSGGNNRESRLFHGFIKIYEEEREFQVIKHKFISGLGSIGLHTQIEGIHKNNHSGFTKQARLQSFLIFARAVEKKCGGNANVKYAWYGSSKQDIRNIVDHGFGPNKDGYVSLSPDHSPIRSMKSSDTDENGVRHIVLCRVILGKTELVHSGSGQCNPSWEEFDNGVDNLQSPNKYIVWRTHMNTCFYRFYKFEIIRFFIFFG
jgi:hypothetical protein